MKEFRQLKEFPLYEMSSDKTIRHIDTIRRNDSKDITKNSIYYLDRLMNRLNNKSSLELRIDFSEKVYFLNL